MLLVARLDHAARRLFAGCHRALTEKLSGFSDYEAGDYLDTTQLPGPSRPYTLADLNALRFSTDPWFRARFPLHTSAATPTAAEDDPAGGLPPTPAGSPTPQK
jgi:hypothetical protein